MGQNFAKSLDISFQSRNETEEFAYTTSWGVSTRMIGGLIMAHADDDGLVIPPRIAAKHIVIMPFLKNDAENGDVVLNAAKKLKADLEALEFAGEKIGVVLDTSDKPGKNWDWVRKGIPLRIALGARDLEKGGFMLSRRDEAANQKASLSLDELQKIPEILAEMQQNIFSKAKKFQTENITEISSLEDLKSHFSEKNSGDAGFVLCYSDPEISEDREKLLKELKITARCIPCQFNQSGENKNPEGICIFSGKPTTTKIIYARAY